MEINYDPNYNIAYIRLREKTTDVETLKISEELNIDISPDGKIYGFELMNANEQLGFFKDNLLTFINSNNHQKIEIPIKL